METYRSEDEQLDALRNWWADNGRSIIFAAVVAIGGTVGWQYWQGHQSDRQLAASESYQQFIETLGGPDSGAANASDMRAAGEQIKIDFAGTTYANFAALHLARLGAQTGDLAEAEAQLRWVLAQDPDTDTRQVTELRLARVLAAAGDSTAALAILQNAGNGYYAASYAIATGDIHLQQGDRDAAAAAYNRARLLAAQALGDDSNLPMLEQKLASLNEADGEAVVLPDSAVTAGRAAPDA